MARQGHAARLARHPEPVVTYIVDRNINYTNICACGCRFCAFFRPPGHPEGYVLAREELAAKVEETVALGGYQILLQGGMHPDLHLDFYTGMLAFLRDRFPGVAVHGFSPPEIVFLAKLEGLSIAEVLAELKASGLASLPGGGAEILANPIRGHVSPNKCPADEWIAVMIGGVGGLCNRYFWATWQPLLAQGATGSGFCPLALRATLVFRWQPRQLFSAFLSWSGFPGGHSA